MATVIKMWMWILLFGVAVCSPVDEFRQVEMDPDLLRRKSEPYRIAITPSGYSPQKATKYDVMQPKFTSKDNSFYKEFEKLIERGYTLKGLTFNIYDDKMREAAIALFRMLQHVNDDDAFSAKIWLDKHINNELSDYVLRLASIFVSKKYERTVEPPFVFKPNFFVNSETIIKALRYKLNSGFFDVQDAISNQFNMTHDSETLTINTNYSGWNFPLLNTCDEKTDYFREDFTLNTFYYGIHLMHPFWMSNEELDRMSPRHAEHYLFAHRQLLARYVLEQEHLRVRDLGTSRECESDFYPYLIYDNGLQFPNRPTFVNERDEARIAVRSIDIALRECISRRILMTDNGTFVKITEDNYVQMLPKLLRAHLDSVKPAKTLRALFGYGSGFPSEQYNPAPSVLHHAQTALRDRAYWYLMERAVNYSIDFINTLEPYNISQYDTEQYRIVDAEIDNITTYFEYFQLSVNRVFGYDEYRYMTLLPHSITARQRRLIHKPFNFTFKVLSFSDQEVVVRLFLGPRCNIKTCWKNYHKFFELDAYKTGITRGENTIVWSSYNSSRVSSEAYYNLGSTDFISNTYNMFKFPHRLMFPRGLEVGLNLTLFVMITPYEASSKPELLSETTLYNHVFEVDGKPLGFPFHRLTTTAEEDNPNTYKFYNISIFHIKDNVDDTGYFSPHLY